METQSKKVLQNIVNIRNLKGFTQDYVASQLGMKQAGYALIEKGQRGLQFELLEQIAIIFEVNTIDIITYPDKYEKRGTQDHVTKVLVELEVSNDEFIKFGLKDKVLQILNK
ncbi:MAG: helix-turn-helix transcriptional regulator [Bacteroidales bacterium]|jgi:transcriptional regulator with XRE-family HTH domain|nr:helix-turn-helix transcriptional regulator [Bacteroidales bacterium]